MREIRTAERLGAPLYVPPPDKGVPPEQTLEELRPLLELPIEHVLPTHGAPTDRAALESALS